MQQQSRNLRLCVAGASFFQVIIFLNYCQLEQGSNQEQQGQAMEELDQLLQEMDVGKVGPRTSGNLICYF